MNLSFHVLLSFLEFLSGEKKGEGGKKGGEEREKKHK